MVTRLIAFARLMWEKLVRYALKFGVVGLAGYVTDVAIFNLLRVGFAHVPTFDEPIVPKIISVTVATLVTWFGNRYWTFREHRRKNYLLELLEFGAVAVGGLLIGLLCLYVSHYVLGFRDVISDNISGNVIGLFLGTTFRFLLYRFWVYGHHRKGGLVAQEHKAEAAALAIFEDDAEASKDADGPVRPVTSHD
jgi:putative flippase GtrA